MADARVTVHKTGAPAQTLELRINGPDANFRIGTEAIAAWAVARVEDLSLDLLDIAGAVFAADRAVRRGGDTRPGFGADWRRNLAFTMAMRRPEFWARTEVGEALVDAVGFLTDDQVSFTFTAGRTRVHALRHTMQEARSRLKHSLGLILRSSSNSQLLPN